MISENLDFVKKNIESSCKKAGRNSDEVSLIAVSKTKPVSMLMEAYEQGCRDFGENKVQELIEKYEVMPKDIRWHMIGNLQRNTVKYIVDKVALIPRVDSLTLAEEIRREDHKKQVTVSVLVEVNIACEETKFGVTKEAAVSLVHDIAQLKGVHVEGLMTIAPYTANPEENRQYFRKLKQLAVDISSKNIDNVNMNVLSMGMTGDYMVAIEEGATYVRVGTGIFGEREYPV